MITTTLHVGRKIVQTITASDGSTVPAGSVAVSSTSPAVTAAVDATTNKVTLTGISVGSATLTYSSPGFSNQTDLVTVVAAPSLVVTDGAETA